MMGEEQMTEVLECQSVFDQNREQRVGCSPNGAHGGEIINHLITT